ncbi:hypothetical protein ACFLYU_05605 [Candidatus Dependentiae bacterium]
MSGAAGEIIVFDTKKNKQKYQCEHGKFVKHAFFSKNSCAIFGSMSGEIATFDMRGNRCKMKIYICPDVYHSKSVTLGALSLSKDNNCIISVAYNGPIIVFKTGNKLYYSNVACENKRKQDELKLGLKKVGKSFSDVKILLKSNF